MITINPWDNPTSNFSIRKLSITYGDLYFKFEIKIMEDDTYISQQWTLFLYGVTNKTTIEVCK